MAYLLSIGRADTLVAADHIGGKGSNSATFPTVVAMEFTQICIDKGIERGLMAAVRYGSGALAPLFEGTPYCLGHQVFT